MSGITRKMQMRRLLAAGAASALFALPAWADEKTGASAAKNSDSAFIDQGTHIPMKKVGEARLKVLLWSVYDSRLYTPSGRYDDGDLPLRLEIQYLRNIRSADLVDGTADEWVAMGRDHPRQEQWIRDLRALWPDIKASDVLTLELGEDSVATFLHNGRQLGRIDDPEFGQQFIDIWLSQDCTRPEIRRGLLGKA